MDIFIGNLPRYAAVSHLDRFFQGYGRTRHFRILEKVLDDGRVVRFGHGVIEPEISAERALQQLNGRRLLGCPVALRPYRQRAPRDRRTPSHATLHGGTELRSNGERRLSGRFRPAPASWR